MPLRYLFLLSFFPTFLWSQEPSGAETVLETAISAEQKAGEASERALEAAHQAQKKALDAALEAEEALRCCVPFKDYLHSYYLSSQLKEELEATQTRYQEQQLDSNETLDNLANLIKRLQKEIKKKEAITKSKGLRLAEYLAFRSTQVEDVNVQGLLAKEAHYLNLMTGDKVQIPLVYEAIYKAFKGLKEANGDLNFNRFNQLPEGRKRLGRLRHIQVDEKGENIYTIGSDGLLLKWDFESYGNKQATKPRILSNNPSISRTFDQSPNGKYLAIGGDTDTILICDSENGQILKKLPQEGNRIWSLKYSPSGDGIIAAQDITTSDKTRATTIYYTNMKGESTPIIAKIPDRIKSIQISTDGKYLAGIGTYKVWIWDILNQELEFSLNPPKNNKYTTAVAFDPSNSFLAVGYQNGVLVIWDLAQVKNDSTYLPERFFSHESAIYNIAFNPEGTLLLAGSLDKTATLWNFRNKKYLGYNNDKEFPYLATSYHPVYLKDHKDWITAVSFNADGTKVITGSANGTMKLWEIDMSLYAKQICSLIEPANKKLKYATWAKYMDAYTDDPEEEAFYLYLFRQRNKERCP